jgi:hypothetical protein
MNQREYIISCLIQREIDHIELIIQGGRVKKPLAARLDKRRKGD